MTGQRLWSAFLAAGVPDADLKDLGYDLFWQRPKPTTAGSANSLLKIGGKIAVRGGILYDALNTGPGKETLEQLASDYDARKSWNAIAQSTRGYLDRVGARLPAEPAPATAAKPKPKPAAKAPARAPATKRVAATKPTTTPGPGFFIPLMIAVLGILGLSLAWRS